MGGKAVVLTQWIFIAHLFSSHLVPYIVEEVLEQGGGATYRSRGMKGVVIRCLQGPSLMRCDPHERSGNAVLP